MEAEGLKRRLPDTMNLKVEWSRPVPMRDATRQNLIYTLDLEKLPAGSGVYVLGRRFGGGFEALYVGKGNNIRSRVKGQLNNLRLMQHVRNAKMGKRIVLAGELVTKPGQRLEVCLPLVERALIRYFLSEGHDLVNIQGTRLRQHEVHSTRRPLRFVPSPMYLEKGKR